MPEAGWIRDLVARDGYRRARVERTATARAMIGRKPCRCISSPVRLDQSSDAVLRSEGADRVGDPALTMLAREDEGPADPAPAHGPVAEAPGLAEDAALPEILSAIAARDADNPELATAGGVTELLADRNEKAARLRQTEAEGIVDEAIQDACITPAVRHFALTLCAAVPEQFQQVLRSAEPACAALFAAPASFRHGPRATRATATPTMMPRPASPATSGSIPKPWNETYRSPVGGPGDRCEEPGGAPPGTDCHGGRRQRIPFQPVRSIRHV